MANTKRSSQNNLSKFNGYLLAALAAAAYGTNPAFAIPLYEDGMNPNTVLLFRYILGLPFLALIMCVRGIGFKLERSEVLPVFILGILMAIGSIGLFESYQYINSGVASTLLFVYPIMVAVIMTFCFHEKFTDSLAVCLAVMCVGLILLMKTDEGQPMNIYGFLLVMLSALTYALYLVFINVSKSVSHIPTTKFLFYTLLFGSFLFLVQIAVGTEVTLPVKSVGWLNLFALAIIPTVISLTCTSAAIRLIGSTPTAVFGALEPVTAIVLSVVVLGQGITMQEMLGGVMIVIATTIVVANKPVDRFILRIRKMFPKSLIKLK